MEKNREKSPFKSSQSLDCWPRMNLRHARIALVIFGIVLPYLARLPRGTDWLSQYTYPDLQGWFLFGAVNAIAWSALLAVSFLYERPASLILPAMLGYGFLAWAHFSLDLRADAQAAVALLFIPIYALVPIAVGAVVGYAVDRWLRRSSAG
jgi:hypothetical protein